MGVTTLRPDLKLQLKVVMDYNLQSRAVNIRFEQGGMTIDLEWLTNPHQAASVLLSRIQIGRLEKFIGN